MEWTLVHGASWDVIEGVVEGQTHEDLPGHGDDVIWAHPIDVHYLAHSLTGWPKIAVQIWSRTSATHHCLCILH